MARSVAVAAEPQRHAVEWTLHVLVCFIALLADAVVLIARCGGRRQPAWDVVLLLTTVIISLTGFALRSPSGTPTPDPARISGALEIVVVAAASAYFDFVGLV
jgi:hypothetical protein